MKLGRSRRGRHARTVRRFTPRRWLPFLALLALVGAAVVISEQVSPTDTEEVRVSSPEALLPVAAVPAPPLVAQVPDDSEALDPVPALPGRWDDAVLPAQLLALAPGAVEIMEMTS